jgi:murein DD-endopeptidase MepM/ murein hydrolase activator NlpD
VPYQAAGLLNGYAAAHGVPFAELFTLFCAENGFFPEKHVSYDLSGIEGQYVTAFDEIRKRYDEENIAPYYSMFANLFNELTAFPVAEPNPDEPVTIYGDSWDVERNYEGIKMHRGVDILDRENLRGRVQVLSMTDGTVTASGFDDWLGYHVIIVTASETTLLYAHLDSVAGGVAAGGTVRAGQEIGRMGDSGGGGETFPVHLHLGISPKAAFAGNNFWINPYPFLRYIEKPRGV